VREREREPIRLANEGVLRETYRRPPIGDARRRVRASSDADVVGTGSIQGAVHPSEPRGSRPSMPRTRCHTTITADWWTIGDVEREYVRKHKCPRRSRYLHVDNGIDDDAFGATRLMERQQRLECRLSDGS